MASTYTSNSGVEKPGIGDQSGEWGTTVNTNMDILDRAINGVGVITLSGTTHTLTTTDGALSDGQYKVLVLSGSPSGTNTITISPNDQDKLYFVVNSSGQTATFSQGSGANVSVVNGDTKIIYADGAGSGAAVTEFASEVDALEGITAGTVAASKAVIVDANKDIGSFRNVTLTGELDAGSLDVSGDADIDGTLEADAMTLNGTAITTTATLSTGISNTNVPVFTTGVADDDFLRVAGTSIEGRSASEVLSDIGGQASLTFGISNTNAVKVDSASVADDEYARFTANGLESRSTSEVLSDIGASAVAGSSSIVTTGALDAGSITSNFGNINNGSSTLTTGALTASSGAIPALTTVTNINSGQIANRNMVYNGAMSLAQRATSASGLGATHGYYTLDRWNFIEPTANGASAQAGRFTMSQVADGPSGFVHSLKMDCTTADTSIASTEVLILNQRFEGNDLLRFKKGTADAEQVTVSFYVKGNASATYVCELYDGDNNRNNTQAFSVTTSWNRIELTFAADTTGAFGGDNALSLYLNIWLHGGSDFTGGTFASNTWASVTNANRYAGSRTSFFDSTDRTFFITGVQMEVGATATNFEYKSFSEELAACQRYCIKIAPATNAGVGTGFARSTTTMYAARDLPVHMRATPTLAFSSATDFQIQYLGAVEATTAMAASELSADTISFQATVGSAVLTAGQGMYLRDKDGGSTIIATAEL